MNKFKTVLALCAAFALAACGGGNDAPAPAASAPAAPAAAPVESSAPAASAASEAHEHHHASEAAHEHHHAGDGHPHHALVGTYQGAFPCADCEQQAVKLVLKDDMSYELNIDNQGGKQELKEQESGKFSWEEEGKILKLDGKDHPMRLVVADGQLQMLADDAKAYDEKNSKYNLKKQ